MSLLLLIYVSNKRSTSGYLIFPKIIVIICHIPLFMLPQATCMSLIKEKTRLTEVAKSSEALDFRPMNGTDLTPTPSHASKDTYYWNRPRPEELLLSLSQGRTNPNLPQRFIKTNSTKLLKETRPDEKRSRRRKKYNYRPYLWTPLRTKNCYKLEPPNLLTPKEIDKYEQSLYSSNNPYSHPAREESTSTESDEQHLISSPMKWVNRMPVPLSTWSSTLRHGRHEADKAKAAKQTSKRRFRSPVFQPIIKNKFQRRRMRQPHGRTRRSNADQSKTQITTDGRPHVSDTPQIVITIHRILIRPSVISLENGGLHARIRYIIQLHKKLTGFYRLTMEVRIDPDYPPIYVGNIQNVCAHWPANLPQSNCSTNKSRFYQKGQICFCHMPPGIYRQRLRLNLTNILDGLEVPKFLVNFLFDGKEINIHLLVKLEDENDHVTGCLSLTLPVLLKSA
ncbi:hypothetical protein FBUS_05323 [Fasciolopsis buskii]|uniref:DUF5739 domain-containing protein n=1 Tax=Fasciolopsis buskii TaxID=27845 RepID=A0A8E0RSI4_9TREM|nr:hypothetical protein FBUS_05323 [Fasciolopsis buski]